MILVFGSDHQSVGMMMNLTVYRYGGDPGIWCDHQSVGMMMNLTVYRYGVDPGIWR